MKEVSREAILRMVGLHDAANFNRLLNSIQLSIEEEKGQMLRSGRVSAKWHSSPDVWMLQRHPSASCR